MADKSQDSPPGPAARPLRQFGELEAVIMDVLWSRDEPATVRSVHDELISTRQIAYTTAMSTMDNLFRKGWLLRDKVGLAYHYRPMMSREEHSANLMRTVFESGGDSALILATSKGHERIVKMLIEGGSDVNNLNRGKWGPLTLAVKHLNGAAAKLVLEAGADANQRTQGICAPWGLHALDILNDHRTPTGGSVSYLDGIDIRKLLKEKTTVPTARELKVQEDERRAKVAAEKAAAEATGAPTPAAVEVA